MNVKRRFHTRVHALNLAHSRQRAHAKARALPSQTRGKIATREWKRKACQWRVKISLLHSPVLTFFYFVCYWITHFCCLVFSRGHATLHLALSVGRLVGRSVGRSQFWIPSSFRITAAAQPSATGLPCSGPCYYSLQLCRYGALRGIHIS